MTRRLLLALLLLCLGSLSLSAQGSHAYWRIFIPTFAAGGNIPVIDLIEFHDSGGSVIATTGGTATASSAQGGGPASNAFDGSVNGSWWICNSGTPPGWIQYQFASPQAVSYVYVYQRQNFNSQLPIDVLLQSSDDGITYTTVYSCYGNWNPGNSGTANQGMLCNSSTQAPASPAIYYRWNITSTDGGSLSTVSGMDLFDVNNNPIATTTLSGQADATDGGGNGGPSLPFFKGTSGAANVFWADHTTPTSGSPNWIQYRWASMVSIRSFKMQARGGFGQDPLNFSIQYSLDGSTFHILQSYVAASWSTNPQTFSVPAVPGGMAPAVYGNNRGPLRDPVQAHKCSAEGCLYGFLRDLPTFR